MAHAYLTESLAREIVSIYRNICKKISSVNARLSLKVASRKEGTLLDRLEGLAREVFLRDQNAGAFVQEDFLGPEWSALLRRDIARFTSNEVFSPLQDTMSKISSPFSADTSSELALSKSPKMSWLGSTALTEYPVLGEVVKAIHCLPGELNGILSSVVRN